MLDGRYRWQCPGCLWRRRRSSSSGGGSRHCLGPHSNHRINNLVSVSRVGQEIIRVCKLLQQSFALPILSKCSATESELSDSPNAVSTWNVRALSRKDGNEVRAHCLDCLGSQCCGAGRSFPGSGGVSSMRSRFAAALLQSWRGHFRSTASCGSREPFAFCLGFWLDGVTCSEQQVRSDRRAGCRRNIGLESRELGQCNHERYNLLIDVDSLIRFSENLGERRCELGQIIPGRR